MWISESRTVVVAFVYKISDQIINLAWGITLHRRKPVPIRINSPKLGNLKGIEKYSRAGGRVCVHPAEGKSRATEGQCVETRG